MSMCAMVTPLSTTCIKTCSYLNHTSILNIQHDVTVVKTIHLNHLMGISVPTSCMLSSRVYRVSLSSLQCRTVRGHRTSTGCCTSPQLAPVGGQSVQAEHGAVDVAREGFPRHGLADPLELQLRLQSGY